MKLVFEKGSQGRRLDLIGEWDVPMVSFKKVKTAPAPYVGK